MLEIGEGMAPLAVHVAMPMNAFPVDSAEEG